MVLFSTSAFWEFLEYLGEGMVFIGVVGEVLTERELILKENKEKRESVESVSSWVLVVGLAISLAALIGTNEYFNGTIASLNLQAKQATERAAKDEVDAATARKEADGFESQIADDNARVKEAESEVASANAASKTAVSNVASAEAASKEASAKAEGFRLQIAQANETAERERLARLQLEARLADRVITPDQKRRIAQAFAPLKGQTIDVVIVGDSLEINRTANAILEGISNAGVLINWFHPLLGGFGEGVIVAIRADAPVEVKQAGTQLLTILKETLGGGVGQADFDKVLVSGNGSVGNTPGAAKVGQSPLRLQIAPK